VLAKKLANIEIVGLEDEEGPLETIKVDSPSS